MELVLLGLFIAGAFAFVVGGSALSFLVALWYGKYYYDQAETSGLRKWSLVRYSSLWSLLRLYVSFQIWDADADTEPTLVRHGVKHTGKVVFACEPHGLIPIAPLMAFCALSEQAFPRRAAAAPRLLVHRLLFTIPLLRDLLLWLGCMNVTTAVMGELLSRNQSIALVPSGSRGIIGAKGSERRHRGFLHVAHKQGASVVPCWTPSEAALFKTWDLFPRLRQWAVAAFGYPFPTPFIGPLPLRSLNMYMGKRIDAVDYKDRLEDFEAAYFEELERLQQKHKV